MITKWQAMRATMLLTFIASAIASVSCGDVARSGKAPAFLVIDSLRAASGASPNTFGNTLSSDAVTLITQTVGGVDIEVPTLFEDIGSADLRVLLKDQGQPGALAGPSQVNMLQVNRYRVVYKRADGHNIPGVDVPYPFDGAITAVATNAPTTVTFIIVRLQAKLEAPLKGLATASGTSFSGADVISTIADVTFYGKDLTGNAFQATGSISINFANWGDPD